MKKTLIIYLADGQTIEKDLTPWVRELQSPKVPAAERLPINPPANHPTLLALAQSVAMGGIEMPGSTPGLVTYLAPAQIKSVQIQFENQLTVN